MHFAQTPVKLPVLGSNIQRSMASAPGHDASALHSTGLAKRPGLLSTCFRCFQLHEEPLANEPRCKQPSSQLQDSRSGTEHSLAPPPSVGRVHMHATPCNKGGKQQRQLSSRPADGSQVR